jgi:membrane protein YqaA with SNARE-associated domain
MFNLLTQIKEKTRAWSLKHANGPHAEKWLAAFSFAEASFFPIPPDVLLIAMLLVKSSDWIRKAFLTTLFSVLGGLFGYLIGVFFYELVGVPLIEFYHLQEQVQVVGQLFAENAFTAIFLAAFTPIPFKVFTIIAGLFKINLLVFVLAAFLGRGMRFFVISYMLRRYGKQVSGFIYKYFNMFSLVVAVFIVGVVLISFFR